MNKQDEKVSDLIQRAMQEARPGAAYNEILAITDNEIALLDIGVRIRLVEYLCLFESQWQKAIKILLDINGEELASPINSEKGYVKKYLDYMLLLNCLPRVEVDGNFYFRGENLNARAGVVVSANNGVPAAQYWAAMFDRIYRMPSLYGDSSYLLLEAEKNGIAMARTEFEKIAMGRGACRYCGGDFKGLFVIKCRNCLRKKDY